MPKIFNRALLVGGELQKVGTPVVRVILQDKDGKVIMASGATVPSDSDKGYAKGAYFFKSSGGSVGGTVYINEGTSSSADFNAIPSAGGAGADTLNSAYENGRTIEVDSGAVTFTDAQATAHTFDIDKTGTGSGNVFDVKFENAHTGTGLYLDMDDGITAKGIHIDSGGTARTGADILFTDDSTGNHSILDVNKSGSGATKTLDYVETYAGSSASFVVSATMGNSNGLDTTVVYVSRGTGVRTAPVIDIEDASTGSADIIDIDLTGVYTGDVFDFASSGAATGNVFFVNLDNAVAMTALHVEGSGVRTQPMVELATDATGSASMVDVTLTGAISGHVFEISMDTTSTGDVLNIDMNAAVGGRAIFIDGGNATRTNDLVEFTNDGDGNTDVIEINDSNTGSGMVFDINVSGIGSGNVIDITYSAADTGDALKVVMADNVAGGALVITGAGVRTDNLVEITTSETGSVDGIIRLDATGVFTGYGLLLKSSGAATTGGLLHLDMDAGVAYKALVYDHAGAREVASMLFTFDGTFASGGGGTLMDINVSMTGAAASPLFDIDLSGVYTGNIIDFATSSASTGTILEINMTNAVAAKLENYTLAGTRTANANTITHSAAGAVDIYQIDDSGTSSGHVWDVNVSGNSTGNVLDIVMSSSKVAGHAIHVDLGTDLAGNALLIDSAGTRTAPLIYIANTGADGGTDDHVLFIYQTGVLDSDLINLEFATGASLGNALKIAMGTNVAGSAIQITSAATGTSGEGAGFDLTHTGDLGAGANVVDIISTGSPSSTSHTVSIQQTTGAGTSGAYALYVNATGANVEAIKVDAGNVVFDEALTVTGTSTLGAVVYSSLNDGTTTLAATALELNRATDVSARLVAAGSTLSATVALHSDKIILLDTATGSVVTLPAAAGTGAVFRFMISVIATSNSHVIQVANANDVMYGIITTCSTGDTPDLAQPWITAADSDTITLNRTTTGSVTIGEWIDVIDIAANKWLVRGVTASSGTEATPFSAAV